MPNASADFDFTGQRYFAGGTVLPGSSFLSTTRASSGLAQKADGTWVSFSSGSPRVTDQGLLIEEARTNLFLNSDAAATQNVTVATGTYVVTVWGTSGSVTTSLGTAIATGFGAITAAVTGTRQVLTVATGGTIVCTVSGSPLYVQFELGAFGTSPIVTAGASATRAADVITLAGAAATAAIGSSAAYAETDKGEGISTVARHVDFNSVQLIGFLNTTTIRISNNANLVNADATLGAGSYTGLVKAAFGYDGSSFTAKVNGGTQATSANAWGTPSGTIYLGNRSAGDRALNGYFRRLTFGTTKGQFDGLTA